MYLIINCTWMLPCWNFILAPLLIAELLNVILIFSLYVSLIYIKKYLYVNVHLLLDIIIITIIAVVVVVIAISTWQQKLWII